MFMIKVLSHWTLAMIFDNPIIFSLCDRFWGQIMVSSTFLVQGDCLLILASSTDDIMSSVTIIICTFMI